MYQIRWQHIRKVLLWSLEVHALPLGDRRSMDLQGSFSHSLAEYTLAACNWFAKDFPRLRAQQKAKKWEPFNVEELRNKTMGVVGYGDIGQACARIARAFGMKVVAMRRSEKLSPEEKQEGLKVCAQELPPSTRTMHSSARTVVKN